MTPAVAPLATPPVAPSALQRPHFRALDGGVTQAPVDAPSLDVQFPVGAAVEMLYVNDDDSMQWYEGVLTRSVLSVDPKGAPDLSYSIKFPGERVRSYKLSRNSLRPKTPHSAAPASPVDL